MYPSNTPYRLMSNWMTQSVTHYWPILQIKIRHLQNLETSSMTGDRTMTVLTQQDVFYNRLCVLCFHVAEHGPSCVSPKVVHIWVFTWFLFHCLSSAVLASWPWWGIITCALPWPLTPRTWCPGGPARPASIDNTYEKIYESESTSCTSLHFDAVYTVI